MVILATDEKELGIIKDANITIDANGERQFSLQIARCNWYDELTFSNYVYVPDTEFGGEIGEVLTDTTLDYVEMKGFTWRGILDHKIIEPDAGNDYKVVNGELHSVMKSLIEDEFDGLFKISDEDTGVVLTNYQFDRYCTLLAGLTKMLKNVGYRLKMKRKREKGIPGYILVEAVPVIDYSSQIELSKDCRLNYTMDDIRNGVNHLIVTGKGELQERNVFHLYLHPDGSVSDVPYYTGKREIVKVYENTSSETEGLPALAEEELRKLGNRKIFKMDVAKLGLDVGIGDIVGGRDYLTGLYAAKPVENITYSLINEVEEKIYKLEGEDNDEDYNRSR